MFENFKARAENSGNTEVKRFATTAGALDFIEELFKKEEINNEVGSYAVWADSPILKQFDNQAMAQKFPGLYFEVNKELAKGAKIGITQLKWGLAETGSMAQDSTSICACVDSRSHSSNIKNYCRYSCFDDKDAPKR